MRKSGHFIMLLRREDTIIHTHTHTLSQRSVIKASKQTRPSVGGPHHYRPDHASVERPPWCGKAPSGTGHAPAGRPPYCGQTTPLWRGAPGVDSPSLGQATPSGQPPSPPHVDSPPGVLSTHLCSCGTCPCVLAAEGPPGSG